VVEYHGLTGEMGLQGAKKGLREKDIKKKTWRKTCTVKNMFVGRHCMGKKKIPKHRRGLRQRVCFLRGKKWVGSANPKKKGHVANVDWEK